MTGARRIGAREAEDAGGERAWPEELDREIARLKLATMGIAMAANLFTFFVFYELLTLSTFPLVVHRGTEKSLHAGNVYLAYTMAGGVLLLLATVWLQSLVGPVDFRERGVEFVTLAQAVDLVFQKPLKG